MYSYEDRMRAVKLYIKYDYSVADTIRELGYPSRNGLVRWHNEYVENGDLHTGYARDVRGVRTKTWTYKSGGSPCIPTRNE